MNVLLTGSLIVLLIVAVLARQATHGKRPEVAPAVVARTAAKRSLSRIGRRPETEIPDPPRQRRNRLKLGLSVTGLPAAESVAQPALDRSGPPGHADDNVGEATGHPHSGDEQFATSPGEPYSPIDLHLGSYIGSVASVPHAIAAIEPDRAGDATPKVGATSEFIDAPGWPHPGDMGFALESFDHQHGNAIVLGTAPADNSAYVPGATSAADPMGADDEGDLFDPARAWTDYAVASDDVPDALPAEWTADRGIEASVAAGALSADESTGWDAHAWKSPSEAATAKEYWGGADWSWGNGERAAAEDASHGAAPLDNFTPDEPPADWTAPFVDDAPVFDEPLDQLTADDAPVEPLVEPFEHAPAVTDPQDELAVPGAPIAQAAPPPADSDPSPVVTTNSALAATPAVTKLGKHTKRLEKRLTTAEDELRRIAKRTKSKKGDLRTAGKKKIAKQVRKALSDPEMAHHFEVRIGKGRLAFERRIPGLPVVTVAGAAAPPMPAASQSADLLAALQEPLRASLLAGLLADYANAEAERRVAEVLRQHAGSRHAPDDFDALVTRLAEVAQRPLLGIDAPPRTRR